MNTILRVRWIIVLAVIAVLFSVRTERNPGLLAQDNGEARTFSVDKVHSSILFRIKHAGAAYFYGRLIDFSGKFTLDEANPANSSVQLTVKSESVRTWSKKRDDHLRSPDFFNAKQFPEISFKSKSVEKAGDDKYKVTGDFTLHGKTKEITLVAEKTGEGPGPQGNLRAGFHTEFEIKRSDYGINKFIANGLLSDTVKLIISLEGVKQ